MKDILEEIEREEALKPKLTPSQHIQDIILASKGYYELSDDEKSVDLMKRICGNITGGDSKDFPLTSVNHWLYEVFIWLVDNEIICKGLIREYILGIHDCQKSYLWVEKPKGKTPIEISFDFLLGSISMCEVIRINLNLNKDLATDNDYIRELRREYSFKYESKVTSVFKDDVLLKEFILGDEEYFDMAKEARVYVENLVKKEYYGL